ncbi:MAG: COX15/CtaA family protein [Burkholderiaceae bacterium]|nr:COX15/CtaA family protein [Burkholderiaceae bacterium]
MTRFAVLLALLLTICITGSSAFIRHNQAGLGCPTAAPCGQAGAAGAVGATGATGAQTAAGAPAPPIDPPAEVRIARLMHRVSAMVVGLLAGIIAFVGWTRLRGTERAAAAFALLVTGALAWLGRYTPHDLPLVTLGNVLGGFALAAAFAWILAPAPREREPLAALRLFGLLAIALLLATLQASLGVMISVRHAVDACAAVVCLPEGIIDWRMFDPLVSRAPDSPAAARALHLAHRASATALVAVCLVVVARARGTALRATRLALIAVLLVQVLLGMAVALGLRPLFAATAHNMVAATLIALLALMAAGTVKPALGKTARQSD